MTKKWSEVHPRQWPTFPAWLAVVIEKLYRNSKDGTLLVRCKNKEWIHVGKSFTVLARIEPKSNRKNPPFRLLDNI